jgi:hypothetical protein
MIEYVWSDYMQEKSNTIGSCGQFKMRKEAVLARWRLRRVHALARWATMTEQTRSRSRAAKQNAPYRKGEGPATRQGGWEPCGFSQHTRSRAKMENNLPHFYQENESVSTQIDRAINQDRVIS